MDQKNSFFGMFTKKNEKKPLEEVVAAENEKWNKENAAAAAASAAADATSATSAAAATADATRDAAAATDVTTDVKDENFEKITETTNYYYGKYNDDGIDYYIKDENGKYIKQELKKIYKVTKPTFGDIRALLTNGDTIYNCNNCYIKKDDKKAADANIINKNALPLPEDAGSDVKPFASGKKKGFFSNSQSSELDLLSVEYDAFNQRVENLNSVFMVIASAGAITAAAGFTVLTAGVGAIPILTLIAFLPLIGRSAQLFPAQWWKSSELQYISGACCAMVTNMSDDLIKLRKFYKITSDIKKKDDNNPIKIDLKKNLHSIDEYLQPAGLYIPVEKNLYKFMFILLNAIDFNAKKEEMGIQQYTFILGLFDYCDFENSKYKIVGGKAQLSEEEATSQRTGKFKYRYTYADKCGFNIWKEDNISESKYGNEENYARSCNNYNDTIVRLLEHKFLSAKDVLTQISNIKDKKILSDEQKTKIENFLKKSSSSSSTRVSRALKQIKETFVGNPSQSYREMLREYTIMAANWGMITSKYAIQYSEFILFVGAEKYKPLLNALDVITSKLEAKIEINNIKVTDSIGESATELLLDGTVNDLPNDGKLPGGRLKSKRQRKRAATTKKRKNRK